ncbi:MAG: hypothetical protein AAGD14_09640 [Planctomycetota bacterium]
MTLLLHAFASLMMLGVIWTVQVVHYPLFRAVGRDHWVRYHQRHVQSMGLIVGPLMSLELLTAGLLVFARPPVLPMWAVVANLVLVLSTWLSTGFREMPRHQKLALRYDGPGIKQLVRGNWFRTLAWSLHGVLVLYLLWLS